MTASLRRTSYYPSTGSKIQLPRGRHGLSREFVLENQRERILSSMVATVAANGYAETAVADVIKVAGVSRKTFYESFKSKEDCFLEAYDILVGRLSAAAIEAYVATDHWTAGIRAALQTALEILASDSALARVVLVEILAAGPRALERYDRAMHHLIPVLDLGRSESLHGSQLPPKLAEEILGGVTQTLYLHTLAGHSEQLQELLDELVYFTLAPFLGHERAFAIAFDPATAS